jgi:hypothetical protein
MDIVSFFWPLHFISHKNFVLWFTSYIQRQLITFITLYITKNNNNNLSPFLMYLVLRSRRRSSNWQFFKIITVDILFSVSCFKMNNCNCILVTRHCSPFFSSFIVRRLISSVLVLLLFLQRHKRTDIGHIISLSAFVYCLSIVTWGMSLECDEVWRLRSLKFVVKSDYELF